MNYKMKSSGNKSRITLGCLNSIFEVNVLTLLTLQFEELCNLSKDYLDIQCYSIAIYKLNTLNMFSICNYYDDIYLENSIFQDL